MNHHAINWALTVPASPTQKHVLLVLANFANDQGVTWPSPELLVKATGLSDRTIRNAKKVLTEKGLIATAPEMGRFGIRLALNINVIETEPHSEKQEPHSEKPEPRSEKPEPHSEKPEPRSEKPEPRSEKPEPRSEKPEPRSEKPEPRSEKPEPHSEKNRNHIPNKRNVMLNKRNVVPEKRNVVPVRNNNINNINYYSPLNPPTGTDSDKETDRLYRELAPKAFEAARLDTARSFSSRNIVQQWCSDGLERKLPPGQVGKIILHTLKIESEKVRERGTDVYSLKYYNHSVSQAIANGKLPKGARSPEDSRAEDAHARALQEWCMQRSFGEDAGPVPRLEDFIRKNDTCRAAA